MLLRGAPAPVGQPHKQQRCVSVASIGGEGVGAPAVDQVSRRALLSTAVLTAIPSQQLLAPHPGHAAATLTVEDVTPKIVPPGPLTPREQQVISVFEQNTFAVANIYDITLQGRMNATPDVDVPEGNGSGVVWDTSGNIVTNYHVLGNVLKGLGSNPTSGQPRVARVTLLGADGVQRTYDGTLVGVDRARDLLVLRVDAPADLLRPVRVGTSAGLKVGQQVLAIGSPFGFDHTLTSGIVSGLNREIRSLVGTSIPGGIQTDAAINPGNSGGPLLDSSGLLVGLNTAIFTNTGTSVGIGFAIPSDTVARVVPQLIANGRVSRPSLGVQVATDSVAARLQVAKGALIQAVTPGGAADKAGLLPTRRGLTGILTGDVILQVNRTSISTAPDLVNALDLLSVGDEVTLLVQRAGDGGGGPTQLTVQATLGAD